MLSHRGQRLRVIQCWRRHYILDVLHNYTSTLTNALDLLGINYEKFRITFHRFCREFFSEVILTFKKIKIKQIIQAEQGLLVSILTAINETSEQDIEHFLTSDQDHDQEGQSENNKTEENISTRISIPLSNHRLIYLEHLLDDIYCFLHSEQKQRNNQILC